MKKFDFIKKEYIMIIILIFVLLSIFIFNYFYKRYTKNYNLSKINDELSLHPYDSFYGKSFVTDTYPIFKDVVFIGDSYAHNISSNLGFDMTNYSCPGFTVSELKHVVDVASKSNKKYVVIFIGPNDFGRNTELTDFYNTLNDYIKIFKNENFDSIILSSYLHSKFSKNFEDEKIVKYTIDEYNNEIIKLVHNYKNVYYFDISDMDEHLDKYQYDPNDNIHFNFEFAVDYINRLYRLLIDIKRDIINNNE